MSDAEREVVPKYRGNPLVDFENGVGLDLRVKVAAELLKAAGFIDAVFGMVLPDEAGMTVERHAARTALDISGELFELAGARGLLYPIPEHGEISPHLRRHIERNVRAQVEQQMCGQRVMREQTGGVMPVGASIFPPGGMPG